MTHDDCIGLLECLPPSGIRDEAIERLGRYREHLDGAATLFEQLADQRAADHRSPERMAANMIRGAIQ